MARGAPPLVGPREGGLDERVVRWLAAQTGTASFNALRRALSAHPESLTRSLRRLERAGVVLRGRLGYSVDDGFHEALGRPAEQAFRSVATVEMAPGVTSEQVLGILAGRWFGRLRWVGVYEREDDPWLVWSVDGLPGQVLLSMHGRTLRVGVTGQTDAPLEELEEPARELLVRGLERLPRGSEAGTLRLARSPLVGGWAS